MSTKEKTHFLAIDSLKREFHDCGKNKAVVYFDGSPATILAASMCVDALGRENVSCVTTTDVGCMNVSRASKEAQLMGVRHLIIPIVLPVASLVNQIEYAGVPMANECCMHTMSRRVASVVMETLACQMEGRVISTMYLISGYDPLESLSHEKLEELYTYYDIALNDTL